jgi:hypothetical protein
MRPVSDAFVDWASIGRDDSSNKAKITAFRKAAAAEFAMFNELTMAQITRFLGMVHRVVLYFVEEIYQTGYNFARHNRVSLIATRETTYAQELQQIVWGPENGGETETFV